jgi:hypothetical protein
MEKADMEKQEGEIVLKSVELVHPGQAYFFTKEWQEGETQVDEDVAKGEVLGPFENIKNGLKALKTAKI